MQLTIAQSIDLAIQRNIGDRDRRIVGRTLRVARGARLVGRAGRADLSRRGYSARPRQQAVQQVAVSALIVLLAGSVTGTFEYAARRIPDSIIGAAVALALNWLVVPPIHIAPASKAIERMAQELSLALADLAVSLRSGMTSARAETHLKSARALATSLASAKRVALGQAEPSFRYNRFARGRHDEMLRAPQRQPRTRARRDPDPGLWPVRSSPPSRKNASRLDEPDQFGRSLADLLGRNPALVRRVGGDRRANIRPDPAPPSDLHEAMRAYWQARADRVGSTPERSWRWRSAWPRSSTTAIDAGDIRA